MERDVILYVGISEMRWHGCEIPAGLGYACVSPITGKSIATRKENWVKVPAGVEVTQDSGAFSDSWCERVSFAEAWERQVAHSEKHRYPVAYRASYDLLIDETWVAGKRSKRRWSYAEAEQAVATTVAAARFAAVQRRGEGLILSAQGVEPDQYVRCVEQITPFMDPDRDKLGLGGWCVLGIRRELMPVFQATIRQVIPLVARAGIRSIHIWGVIYPPALGLLLYWADEYGLTLSTDSASPSLQVVRGNWGVAEWRRNVVLRSSDMGATRMIHACQMKQYLGQLRQTMHYQSELAVRLANRCAVCGKPISGKAKTCGAACRQRKSRAAVTLRR